jgi:hypothetical protein
VPGAAARRGTHSIAAELSYQLLWHRVTVADAGGGRVITALRGAVATAAQEIAPSWAQHYAVGFDGDRYAVAEEGDAFAVAATAELAAEAIAARSRRRALELAALKGWVRLRGGLVDLAGKRILLVGPAGSGKTVLLLRLALRGGAPQGDESVLLREGLALALPAPLLLEEPIGPALSELAELAPALPRTGGRAALDPARDLGIEWRLSVAPLDHIVVLDPRPGRPGRPSCLPSTPGEALTELAGALEAGAVAGPVVLRELTAAVSTAACHRLRAGEVKAMEDALVALAC